MLGLALATFATLGLVQDPAPSAAKAAATPTIQRPSATSEAPQADPTSPQTPPEGEAPAPSAPAPADTPQTESPADGEASQDEPEALPPSDSAPVPEPAPAAPELLAPSEGEEAEAPLRRPTRSQPRGDIGVSKEEALRRYYAKLYRPADNPIRPTFATRFGLAVLGGNNAEINGRVGTLELEGGASWNKFSFGVGGGLWFGTVRLDDLGDTVSLFGATGALSLGLGRLGYTKRAILDPRLAYRATWMPLTEGRVDSPPPEAAAIIPHGPEFRLDAAFMASRSRQPRFFHAFGAHISVQVVVHTVGVDLPVFAVPRIGLVYSFS